MVKERELFVKYFQKPTQIYKYIADKRRTAPIFLNRNVEYLRHRMSRNHSARQNTTIDQISKQLRKNALTNIQNGNSNNRKCIKNVDFDNAEVSYNFICNRKVAQNTRCSGYKCPWCELNARFRDALMIHLTNCHMRFKFKCVEADEGCRIDITLNEQYDGSYCGFKYPGHDLHHDFRFTPKGGPLSRSCLTQVIYYNSSKRKRSKVAEVDNYESLQFDDGEAEIDVCSGRLYYHTSTCLPIKPNELDLDSEADIDPDWLRERTKLMIDEFTDVNEGEKEILKLWNLHIMTHCKHKADNLIRGACFDFVEKHGETIIMKNLYKNFTLHLANLYDYGLLSSGDLIECVRLVKKKRIKLSCRVQKSSPC